MDSREPTSDKRRFRRIPFTSEAHLVSAEGSWHCQLLDISLKGILTTLPKQWPGKPGEHYLVELPLENSDVVIRMEAAVVHVEADHAGFRCVHIDLDSISHLRRLVELNLGDAAILQRELTELSKTA
jgi:hypothetical protein